LWNRNSRARLKKTPMTCIYLAKRDLVEVHRLS